MSYTSVTEVEPTVRTVYNYDGSYWLTFIAWALLTIGFVVLLMAWDRHDLSKWEER